MAGKPGQGRRFDVDTALDCAMTEFWISGFEATPVARLTAAMGITAPSMYRTFGDKRALFFRAIEHYTSTVGSFMNRAFAADTDSATLIRRLLHDAATTYAADETPRGCLIISATVTVLPAHDDVATALRDMRQANIEQLAERIRNDRGAVSWLRDAADEHESRRVARYVGTVLQGMSHQARDGATVAELTEVADLALTALGLHARVAA